MPVRIDPSRLFVDETQATYGGSATDGDDDDDEEEEDDGDGDGHLMMVQAKRKMHISYYIITNNAPKMEAPIGSSKAPGQSGVETVTS